MKKVLVIFIALLLLAGFAIYQDELTEELLKLFGMSEEINTISGIASVREFNRNVTIKRANHTIWNNANQNEKLAVKDSVSTGFDSNAKLNFDLGYIMNIGERSLIVVENPEQNLPNLIEISFDHGSLDAENLARNDATLRIRSNKMITQISGKTDFSMTVDKEAKRADIWMRTGTALIKDKDGNELTIGQNERLTLSTENIAPKPAPEPEPEPELIPEPAPEPEPVVKPATIEKPTPKKPERRLARNEIIRAITKQRSKIDTCYNRSRTGSGGATMTVRVTVKNTGVVSNTVVSRSSLNDPQLEDCVTFWIKAIRFPEFDGAAVEESVNFAFQ